MLRLWDAEQGMESGILAMASTSSMLQTSILLYTYLRQQQQTGPSMLAESLYLPRDTSSKDGQQAC